MDHFCGHRHAVLNQLLYILATDEVDGVWDGGLEAGNNFCT
jgi:hypothetical protein